MSENNVLGFAYYIQTNNIKTYSVIFDNSSLFYKPLKEYNNLSTLDFYLVLKELDRKNYKSFEYWSHIKLDIINKDKKLKLKNN